MARDDGCRIFVRREALIGPIEFPRSLYIGQGLDVL